jgi:signal peptidase I
MIKRFATFVVSVALIALVGIVGYAWSNGVRFYGVESGSMAPAFGRGDLVIAAPTTAATPYQVGEIVTFHPTPGYTTTHRIVAIDALGLSTKGDANPTVDIGRISTSSVVGRVVAIVPYGGSVAAFFRQPAGIGALIMGILGLYLAGGLLGGKRPGTADDDPAVVAERSPAVAPESADEGSR